MTEDELEKECTGTMTVLQTPRLLLREFSFADGDALARILCDPETMRYYPARYDRAAVERWIERNRRRYQDDGVGLWAIERIQTRELIGDCGIVCQQVEGEPFYEIGYHLRSDCWRQGFATEAATACRDWGFRHLKTERLVSLIRPGNLASRLVAGRIGMTVSNEVSWRGLPHLLYAIERANSRLL
ncbi:MAG: GNAT family N-acetyltransferase [Terriglobales bacterium]|jgi:RimJ/RimL family protein N-acetyltransferase